VESRCYRFLHQTFNTRAWNKGYFPRETRRWNVILTYILLHDTLLTDDGHRTGISDTPVCECGVKRQSADHFLLRCNRHLDARIKLKNVVENIMDLSACRSRIHLSESLLLAPRCNDVTRKQNILIIGIVIPGSRTFFSIPNPGIGKAQITGFRE